MPSTRSQNPDLVELGMDYSDDDFDPDYREDSEDDAVDDIPKNMQRDRARWVESNVEDIEWLYRKLLEDGRSIMGRAFLQTCTINHFAYFLYRHTTPFSEP